VAIDGRSIRTLEAGDSFGEIALLHSVPRTATVTATADVRLWKLARVAFLAAVSEALPAGAGDDGMLARPASLVV
jgi:CRP-like cAMP-binding protein